MTLRPVELTCELCGAALPLGRLHYSTGTGSACARCWDLLPSRAAPPLLLNQADLVEGLRMLDPAPIRWRTIAVSMAGFLALCALLGALVLGCAAGCPSGSCDGATGGQEVPAG